MKNLRLPLLATFAALAVSASAQFVNFADSGTPVTLNAFLYIDGDPTNYVTSTVNFPNPGQLADGGNVSFEGDDLFGINGLSFTVMIHDDGAKITNPWLTSQTSFYIANYSGSAIPVSANSLHFGVSGLFALGGATLESVFNYYFAADETIAGYLVPHYDETTGTFSFTNDTAFVIPNSSILTFFGNYEATSAIPEPSTYAALAGAAALALACWRRRVERTDPSALALKKAR